MGSIKHRKTSTIPNALADTQRIGGDDWNNEHEIDLGVEDIDGLEARLIPVDQVVQYRDDALAYRNQAGTFRNEAEGFAQDASTYVGSLTADDGATKVGTATGDSVQDALDGRPTAEVLAGSGGAASIGLLQSGASSVAQTLASKTQQQIAIFDALNTAQRNDTQLASPLLNLGPQLQSSVNDFKTRKFKLVNDTSIRYGTKLIENEPGQYRIADTLLIDGDLNFRARGGHSSVVIQYDGTGTAIVVNSTNGAVDAPQNTRVFALEGVAIYAPAAAKGIYFGGATQRHIEILHSQVIGIPGRAIDMGEAVYFLRIGNCDVKDCAEGIYVGHYCDMFTVDDRCMFTRNSGPDLILGCPTFRIDNNDFEGAIGASAHIRIVQSTTIPAGVRGGIIHGNRFGPEGSNPARYDIEFVDDGVVTAAEVSTDTRIWNNIHFSNSGGTAKIAPVNIASKTRRLDFRGYRWSLNYTSGYYVTTTDASKAFASGTVCDSRIDDIMDAHPSIRGLFETGGNGKYERAWAANTSIVNLSVLRRTGTYTGADRGKYEAFQVAPIVASVTGNLHEDAIGVAMYDQAVSGRPIWYAINGTVIPSTLDTTGSSVGAPVYLQASGGLGLTPTAFPLVVARVHTVGANAKLLVSIENKRASVVVSNTDLTARGFDQQSIVYNSAITADRTVTLNATTPAIDDVLRVSRTALSTGAFNIIVGAKNLTPGTFAEFTYTLSGWLCTASGSL